MLAGAAMVTAMAGAPATAAPSVGEIRSAGGATAVADSYIVVLKDSSVGGRAGTRQAAVKSTAASLADRFGGTLGNVYGDALNGFSVKLSEQAAKRLAAHPAVDYVEQNHTVTTQATQFNPPWGLDRIDQRNLPLSASYNYSSTGAGVTAYIIDTGIRKTHVDFAGQAVDGFDAIDGGPADDCNGHGTHVAGTVGGNAYGVAKDVRLVAVRVLNCAGSGTWDQVIAGVNWVTGNHLPGQPAVANMSLGGGLTSALNTAVANSIADGVTYAVASGNSYGANACNYSPASVPTALTVNASQSNDARATFSNIGTCTDIFAPGVSVLSAWSTSDTATNTISGTSMASPHVAGAAARVLQLNPTWTPAQVHSHIVTQATPNVISNAGTGSPNRLLYAAPTS
jgi:subtilisin family serine protease